MIVSSFAIDAGSRVGVTAADFALFREQHATNWGRSASAPQPRGPPPLNPHSTLPETGERKIIYASHAVDEDLDSDYTVLALCDDGAVWWRELSRHGEW